MRLDPTALEDWSKANRIIGAALREWFGIDYEASSRYAVAIQARLAHADDPLLVVRGSHINYGESAPESAPVPPEGGRT